MNILEKNVLLNEIPSDNYSYFQNPVPSTLKMYKFAHKWTIFDFQNNFREDNFMFLFSNIFGRQLKFQLNIPGRPYKLDDPVSIYIIRISQEYDELLTEIKLSILDFAGRRRNESGNRKQIVSNSILQLPICISGYNLLDWKSRLPAFTIAD